jgi:hypothetical protein
MLEREPGNDVETRAAAMREQAAQLLEDPDFIGISQQYLADLPDGISLRLSGGLTTGSEYGDMGVTQYLYLSRRDSDKHVDYYIDIQTLVVDGSLAGFLDDETILYEAQQHTAVGTPERRLIDNVVAVLDRLQGSEPPSTALSQDLALNFSAVISQGALATQKTVSRTLADGSLITVDEVSISGDIRYMHDHYLYEPVMKISVQELDIPVQTVLEFYQDGLIETYFEPADTMEQDAQYTAPENIERDEDGTIIFLVGNIYEKQAIIAAERAIGSRQLRPEFLEIIEKAMLGE